MAATRVFRLAAALLAPWLLSACAGNGIGLDAGGRPLGPGGNSGGPLTASFQSIQEQVFTPICTVCHAGAAAPQGLRLDSVNSYAMLVGVPSSEVSSLQRVRAGDPDNSYLIQKLEGHAAVGAQMPFGGPYLPAATIAVIRQWITDGAQPPPPTAGLGLTLLAIAPAPQDVLAAAPARILLSFSTELDQTRIEAGTLQLERGAAATGYTTVPALLRLPQGNTSALMLEPLQPLGPGHYRVLMPAVRGQGLAGLAGERLASGSAADDSLVLGEFDVAGTP